MFETLLCLHERRWVNQVDVANACTPRGVHRDNLLTVSPLCCCVGCSLSSTACSLLSLPLSDLLLNFLVTALCLAFHPRPVSLSCSLALSSPLPSPLSLPFTGCLAPLPPFLSPFVHTPVSLSLTHIQFVAACVNAPMWYDVFFSIFVPYTEGAGPAFVNEQRRCSAFTISVLESLFAQAAKGLTLPAFR